MCPTQLAEISEITMAFEWGSQFMERIPEESDDSDDAMDSCKSDGSDLENTTDQGLLQSAQQMCCL